MSLLSKVHPTPSSSSSSFIPRHHLTTSQYGRFSKIGAAYAAQKQTGTLNPDVDVLLNKDLTSGYVPK